MKNNYFLIILLMTCFSRFSTAQILCIYCYDQNDTISANVNNLILNGGFENNNCLPNDFFSSSYCPNSNYYNCDITNWTCTGGGTNTYADMIDTNYAHVVEGNEAVYFGNSHCHACSGFTNDTSCFNNLFCMTSGIPSGYPVSNNAGYGGTTGLSLGQTVSGLIIGNTYVLEFWVGGEYNGGYFTKNGLFALDIGFGDTLIRNKPTQAVTGIGTRYIVEFNATSSSHTIKFTNWGHVCGKCTELILDDVRLYTLAELSTSIPNCTIGIDASASQYEIKFFPNPVATEFNLETNDNELSEIILYDIVSRKIMHMIFTNSVSFNAEQLEKGVYLYEVRSRRGFCKKGKFIKD